MEVRRTAGGTFENGEPVRARDVVRGIRRSFDTSSERPFVSVRWRRNLIEMRFAHPSPDVPYLVSAPAFGPVPAGPDADAGRYRLHPWATGPYLVQSYVPGQELVLTRNPQWDPGSDPGRTQYPEGYVFRAGVPSAEIDQQLQSGSGATTLTYDDVRPQDLHGLQDAGRVVSE